MKFIHPNGSGGNFNRLPLGESFSRIHCALASLAAYTSLLSSVKAFYGRVFNYPNYAKNASDGQEGGFLI